MHFLIVEDEPDLLHELEAILKKVVPSVITAKNGTEALKIFETMPIAAVMSDIVMPQMSGLALLKEIRGRGIQIPFIFVSGNGEKLPFSEALSLNVMSFLSKPFDIAEFKELARKAFSEGSLLLPQKNKPVES